MPRLVPMPAFEQNRSIGPEALLGAVDDRLHLGLDAHVGGDVERPLAEPVGRGVAVGAGRGRRRSPLRRPRPRTARPARSRCPAAAPVTIATFPSSSTDSIVRRGASGAGRGEHGVLDDLAAVGPQGSGMSDRHVDAGVDVGLAPSPRTVAASPITSMPSTISSLTAASAPSRSPAAWRSRTSAHRVAEAGPLEVARRRRRPPRRRRGRAGRPRCRPPRSHTPACT